MIPILLIRVISVRRQNGHPMPWCESAGKPSRIIVKTLDDGSRVRAYKINGETLKDK